jgi:hypothetical protein
MKRPSKPTRKPAKTLKPVTPKNEASLSPFASYTPVAETDYPYTSVCAPPPAGIEKIKRGVPFFEMPAYLLRRFKMLIYTDQGLFENNKVTLIDRLVTADRGRVILEFDRMEIVKPVTLLKLVTLDDEGRLFNVTKESTCMKAGDYLNLTFSLSC